MTSPTQPRLAHTLAVLALGVFSSALFAVPPFPPGPGGSMPNPPRFPNNPPPNFPNPPQPNFPNFPQPNIPNPPQPNFPNFPGGHFADDVWTCGGCGRELGRGPIPPALTRCPFCGVRLVGVDYSGINNPPPGGPAGNPAPGGSAPAPGMPFNPPAPAAPFNPPAPLNDPPPVFPAGPAPAFTGGTGSSPSSPPSVGPIILGVVVIGIGVAILGGAACLIIFTMSRNSAPKRRRRLRFDIDDDYR